MGTASTLTALHAAHAVEQENQKAPEGNEFEAPLGEMTVTRRWLMTSRASRLGPGARSHGDLDALAIGRESGLLIDEHAKAVALV